MRRLSACDFRPATRARFSIVVHSAVVRRLHFAEISRDAESGLPGRLSGRRHRGSASNGRLCEASSVMPLCPTVNASYSVCLYTSTAPDGTGVVWIISTSGLYIRPPAPPATQIRTLWFDAAGKCKIFPRHTLMLCGDFPRFELHLTNR